MLPAFTALIFFFLAFAHAAEETAVEVEKAPDRVRGTGVLGTRGYSPRDKEKPFMEKLAPEEAVTGNILGKEEYSIHGKKGKFVSWLGIVRTVAKTKDKDEFELLIENKFFDGLTDIHILALSFNGGGDFKLTIKAKEIALKPLMLVRAYGTVSDEKDNMPQLEAVYVRGYPWKTFTFLDAYGKDLSNKAWREKCKVKLDDIYNPYPTEAYYGERLGEPEEKDTPKK